MQNVSHFDHLIKKWVKLNISRKFVLARSRIKPLDCCNIEYLSKTPFKAKISWNLCYNIHFSGQVDLKFCTEHGNITTCTLIYKYKMLAVSRLCHVQNFKTNGQFWNKLWANKVSRDLSFGRFHIDILYCKHPPVHRCIYDIDQCLES